MITGKKLKICPACNKEHYYDTSFMSELSEEKKRIIQSDFEAKFRNQRLC